MSREPHHSEGLSLEEAARIRQESEQNLEQARMMRNIRDMDAAAAMAFLIIAFALALNRTILAIIPTVVAVMLAVAAGLMQTLATKTLRGYHETRARLENELNASDYQDIMGRPHPWKTF